ncbi:YqgQ family protein [Periweissella fabalis]|uniref:YqgQ family protein n=1 Tax=Periweissella fabalis TaxID=1070421 RepID=A0A7X6N2E2_9LACO|nr:YqgQ family protein [Periweissella fabalis]MCM0598805.1 YqgQ family protein [Periweissella fabalis]NKZ24596.1 YqgQ family protein [Periweissella fabalis]
MNTYYDILQYLKKFDVYIYVGSRLGDLELAALEIDNLYRAGVLEEQRYAKFKLILRHEHTLEEQRQRI